jgi:hypothetical protein
LGLGQPIKDVEATGHSLRARMGIKTGYLIKINTTASLQQIVNRIFKN